ncbi:MAG: SRPBCC family protein [Novosphingobium sp.]|nr:SRPBCC family protein [Novosphingobium sp.]MCP5404199.1 SRPBCC family protein [Novosphingobium sp.]
MIDTEQRIEVAVDIDRVWDYVKDMQRWAELMPGMREFTVIDDDNSRWVLKVGVGGLVRTVTVDVHVDRWDGPEHVTFSYQLQGDPVLGGGTYDAVPLGDGGTEIVLNVRVEGSGPMAPMWEAMGRPLLPQLAKGFADQLKDAIEKSAGVSPAEGAPAAGKRSLLGSIGAWLRKLWQALFGKSSG